MNMLKAQTRAWFYRFIWLLLILSATANASPNPVEQLVQPKQAVANLKSSPVFAGRGDGITTCPVTGEKIKSKKLKAEMHGRTGLFLLPRLLKSGQKKPGQICKTHHGETATSSKSFPGQSQCS